MEIIPAVDVLDGNVVRLRRGRQDDVTIYGTDPVRQARTWIEQGAERVHVVDLRGAFAGRWDAQLWSSLGAAGVPFQAAGGIRSAAAAAGAIASGAERVVVGTAAIWHQTELAAILSAVDSAAVVAAVDVRDGRATGRGWVDEGRPLDEVLAQLEDAGVRRALVTGIARDGMLTGPDLQLLSEVIELAPNLSVIASGGIGSLDHLRQLTALPVEGVIVGRALYDQAFTLAEALAAVEDRS